MPSANALSVESVGLGSRSTGRVQAAVEERLPRAESVRRVAAVEGDAELILAVDREVHDHRLDEDLAARLVEPVDDGAEVGEVAQARGDDDRVGRLVRADLDARLEDRQRRVAAGSSRRRRGAARRRRAPVTISLSVFASSTASACWSSSDVDLAFARVRDVEPLDELEDAQVGALGAMMTSELLRSSAMIFVTWTSLPDGRGRALLARLAAAAAAAAALDVEHLVEPRRDVRRDPVVNRLDPDSGRRRRRRRRPRGCASCAGCWCPVSVMMSRLPGP